MFIDEFTGLLDTFMSHGRMFVLGEFTLHFDQQDDTYVKPITNLLESHCLEQLVRTPTRKSTSSTGLPLTTQRSWPISRWKTEIYQITSVSHLTSQFANQRWKARLSLLATWGKSTLSHLNLMFLVRKLGWRLTDTAVFFVRSFMSMRRLSRDAYRSAWQLLGWRLQSSRQSWVAVMPSAGGWRQIWRSNVRFSRNTETS